MQKEYAKPKVAYLAVLLLVILENWQCTEFDLPSSGIDSKIDGEDYRNFIERLDFSVSKIDSRGRVTIGFKHATRNTNKADGDGLLRDTENLLVRFVYQALSGNRSVEKRKQVSIALANLEETKVPLELIKPNSNVLVSYRIIKNGFVGKQGFEETVIPIKYHREFVKTFARITSLKANPKVHGKNFVALNLAYKLDELEESCQEYEVHTQIVYPQLKLNDPVKNKVHILSRRGAREKRLMELYVIPCTLAQVVLSTKCTVDKRKLNGQSYAQLVNLKTEDLLKNNKDVFEFSTEESNFLTIHHPNFYGPSCANLQVKISYEGDDDFERELDEVHLSGRETRIYIENSLKKVQNVKIKIGNEETGKSHEFRAKLRMPIKEPDVDTFLTEKDVLSLINGFDSKLSSKPQISTNIKISKLVTTQKEIDVPDDGRKEIEENDPETIKKATKDSGYNLSILLIVLGAIVVAIISVCLFVRLGGSTKTHSKKPPLDKKKQKVFDNGHPHQPKDVAVEHASVKFMDNSQGNALDDIRRMRMEDAMKKKKLNQKQKLNSYAKSVQILKTKKIDDEITAETAPKCESLMRSEFEAIGTFRFDKIFTKDACILPHNSLKIRAKENFCYDHSRVELRNSDSDFIHANFVPDTAGKERFIVTQGPLPQTNSEFWMMAFEQNVCLVVSVVTDQEECQYKLSHIPEFAGKPFVFGKIEVIREEFKEEQFFSSAKVVLRNLITGDQTKLILMRVKDWPDHMHPKHACLISPVIRRIGMIMDEDENRKRPAISHCIAGIGRSASIFAIRCLLDEVALRNKCNPAAFVLFANQYRHRFAMSYEPYCFIQQFIQNHLASQKFALSTWNDLLKYDWTNFRESSEILRTLHNFVSIVDPELSEGGETKRERVKRNAPYSSYTFTVNTLLSQNQTNGDFINASYIPGIEPNEYIVTQTPLENTVKDFWNMILCHKLRYVILLGQKASFLPDDDDSNGVLLTDYARIDLISATRTENIVVFKCKVVSNDWCNTNHHGNRVELEVSVVVAEDWTLESCMNANVRDMMDQYLKCWKLSFKNYNKTPLLIVDELGSTLAIQLSLLLTLIRMKKRVGTDKSALSFDLVNYLQILSLHRPGCLGSVEEFGKLIESAGYYITNTSR